MEESVVPQKKRFSGLAFLEVGLFELIFVVIVLLLLFGALNYFNILSVSSVFPDQLGWLPRQQAKVVIKPSPTPTNFTSSVLSSTNSASLLTEFIKSNIKKEILPREIVIQRDQQAEGKISMSLWGYTAPTATFSAYIHYRENTTVANDIKLFILVSNDKLPESAVNASLANAQIAQYLSNAQSLSNSDCHEQKNVSYCQLFKEEENGKTGFGLAIYNNLPSKPKTVFSCIIPKESEDYSTTTSCISL